MLAVTANWMLTDGTLAPARRAVAREWLHTIRRAVIRAGFRRDGRYQPVESVSLVFAGDTFDWLLSNIWSGRERPWHGGQRSREARSQVAVAGLRSARPVLAGLRRWLRHGITVPAADRCGRPSARGMVHAQVRVVVLGGDRDAWITEGLASDADAFSRFGVWVGESWSDGQVTVRHGHDRDPSTHAISAAPASRRGRPPSLAESVALDLVVPFAMTLRAETAVWHLARPRLPAIAAAVPVDIPRAVAGLVNVWGATNPTGRRVLLSWQRRVAGWAQAARREPPAYDAEYDPVDGLAAWLEAGVVGNEVTVPLAVSRLTESTAMRENQSTILGHGLPGGASEGGASLGLDSPGGPWLATFVPQPCFEPLGRSMAGPSVVAIGMAPGNSIVEAA